MPYTEWVVVIRTLVPATVWRNLAAPPLCGSPDDGFFLFYPLPNMADEVAHERDRRRGILEGFEQFVSKAARPEWCAELNDDVFEARETRIDVVGIQLSKCRAFQIGAKALLKIKQEPRQPSLNCHLI